MHTRKDVVVEGWPEYELLDSGEHMKLERFGDVLLARPETQALWEKSNPELWSEAHATFSFKEGKGAWANRTAPSEWEVAWGDAKMIAQLTNFKHIGIFPEQAPNWTWLQKAVGDRRGAGTGEMKVLNLFGYTGIASIVAAQAGAKVTHVDASKQSLEWARENMHTSGLPEDAIRWILDDALVFAKREAKRGNVYDGIILDPPAFGRGAKGEVWHIEESLPRLMQEIVKIRAVNGFLLLNGYAAGYTPISFLQLVLSHFPDAGCEYGELQLPETSGRILSQGIYVRCGAAV